MLHTRICTVHITAMCTSGRRQEREDSLCQAFLEAGVLKVLDGVQRYLVVASYVLIAL